ncbi:MAG TPA: deoxyhypusine synthase family protein [Candidatus Binataceae bacterium]
MAKRNNPSLLTGSAINPHPVRGDMTAADLVDNAFLAYNGRRLREACRLFVEKMLQDDTVVGMSVTGALTPAGLGMSCLIPLIEHGFVDWMVSTGANLYHDTHFGLGLKMFQGQAEADDVALREAGVVRIYDIFFDYQVLLSTDAFFRQIARQEEFQHPMGSAEFHYRAGRYVAERERVLKLSGR